MIRTELEDVRIGTRSVKEDDFGLHFEGWVFSPWDCVDLVGCRDR